MTCHCLVVILTALSAVLLSEVSCDYRPNWYTVNLDDPPETRWTTIINHHRDIITDLQEVFRSKIPSFVYPFVERLSSEVNNYLPEPYAREMQGIAHELNSSVGVLVLENLLYDITAGCTSIVAQDKNGTIWHARNMDYHFTEKLKKNTVNVNFVRGGKVLYQATSYAGYVGVLTGQKPKAFTISMNERREGELWLNAIMLLLTRKHSLAGLLLRETMEGMSNFKDAVDHLSSTLTVAPAYYTLGGVAPDEGVVITKGRFTAERWYLQEENGRWYVLETNYDRWLPPPASDDRRDAGIKHMNQTGQAHINAASLYHVLSIPPVLQTISVYTTVMSAAQPDVYKSCIRDNSTTKEGC